MKFQPFPSIQSERLFLRRVLESDGAVILFLRSDKLVTKYIQRPEHRQTKSLSDAVGFIKELDGYLEADQSITWGITLKGTSEIIGTICLWNFSKDRKQAEVGYDLIPRFQRKGIMSESLKSVLAFGFEHLKLELIEAYTHKENESSKRLLLNNQFKLSTEKKDEHDESNLVYEISQLS